MSAREGSHLEEALAFQMRVAKLPAFEREARFHLKRRWRFDFLFRSDKVAVEVEGGTMSGGRHVRPVGFENDCEKYSEAAIMGYRVIRCTAKMVADGRALALIERALGVRPLGVHSPGRR